MEPVPGDPGDEESVSEGQAFTALFIAGAIGGDPTIQREEILTENALALFGHLEERFRAGLSQADPWGGLEGND